MLVREHAIGDCKSPATGSHVRRDIDSTTTLHRPRPELTAHKAEVVAAIKDGSTSMRNALNAEDHAGSVPTRYQRPGRIPSSVNVLSMAIGDPETHAYLPAAEIRTRFAEVGATRSGRVITYYGGGNVFVSCKSAISNPCVKQEDTGASRARASVVLPCNGRHPAWPRRPASIRRPKPVRPARAAPRS